MKMQPEYTRGHIGIVPFWAVTVPYVTSDVLVDDKVQISMAGMGGWALTKRSARKLARKFQAEIDARR